MAMSLEGWADLVCECGNKFFNPVVTLGWHESQGMTVRQDGYTCTGCGKRSDTAPMVLRLKERNLQRKIDELQAQRASL